MYKKYILIGVILSILLISSEAKILTIDEMLNISSKRITSITTKEVITILKRDPNIKLIDIRTKSDILKQGGFIKANNVSRIPRDKLEFLISNEVQENETFIVYCYDGKISQLATKQLQDMGYKNVLHYKDSFKGWEKAKQKISSLEPVKNQQM